MTWFRSLCIAFSMYSRIPVPYGNWDKEDMKYAIGLFPLVGAVTGGLSFVWLRLADKYTPAVTERTNQSGMFSIGLFVAGVLIGAVIPIIVTGGIHVDGFMDTSDALASWQPMEKRLEILKDSHTGAFAVMHCAGYLLLAAALYSEAKAEDGPVLGCAFILSRAMSAWALTAFKNARPQGMLDAFAQATQKRMALRSGICYGLFCLSVWGLLGGWLAVLCPLEAALCLLSYRHMAYKRFGGVTGDLAGWFLQVTELALTAVIIGGGRLL